MSLPGAAAPSKDIGARPQKPTRSNNEWTFTHYPAPRWRNATIKVGVVNLATVCPRALVRSEHLEGQGEAPRTAADISWLSRHHGFMALFGVTEHLPALGIHVYNTLSNTKLDWHRMYLIEYNSGGFY